APVSVPASGDVASYAVQFIGSRYVWGGSSPRGFDCSGLTSYVYRQFGVNLPHSAAGKYSTRYGAMIGSMGSLAPGDLMFFANTGGRRGITHVAIYLGGGRMVHAMTPSYGVQASSIWSSYWQNTFVGAIRPYR
ncbi:MAG: NlpC/P60 family protein, partial [Chloroflexia bacterium]|nr:NlpC/P60 family protein [Chloroflexia bacterium]